jgi:ATP-binding cassette subfamily B protein
VYQSLIYLLVVGALAVVYTTKIGAVTSLGAAVLLLVRAGAYGQTTQVAYQVVRQWLPHLEQVQDAQDRYVASVGADGLWHLQGVDTVAFTGVHFAYLPDKPVLSDVSFDVRGGEAVGIVGPSGAGKSTLVQILLRLREPDSGQYLVNGVPAAEYTSRDWHHQVAYVPQEPKLLHASVRENIAFYRDLDESAITRAAKLAGIHDEILGWANGYETAVGPRADAVSGGQQQRICLARALAARPAILVLDEPTSALDPLSERLIQQSLAAIRHKVTLFVIAHRMSTLDICDRVMVIMGGRLDAFDAAERLRETNAYFRSAAPRPGPRITDPAL